MGLFWAGAEPGAFSRLEPKHGRAVFTKPQTYGLPVHRRSVFWAPNCPSTPFEHYPDSGDKERALLALGELVTLIADGQVPDSICAGAAAVLASEEIAAVEWNGSAM